VKTYRIERAVFACLLILPPVFSSQLVRAQEPVFTTVCAVMQDPAAFAGQMVKLRATVRSHFEVSTIVDANGPSCDGPWLQYAPKPGPRSNSYDAEQQQLHPVFLVEDENMRRFNDAREAVVYPRDNKEIFFNSDPNRYKVTATMTGRVDNVGRDGRGFGHLNAYRVRFVLSSVQDVATEEISYDWAEFSREPVRFPHGTIRGRLTDALGKPVKSAWVEAIPAKDEIPISNPGMLTNEDGSYSLNVEPGKYFVVINRTNPASDKLPVLTTYFPSAETEGDATTLIVTDYAELTAVNIHIRRSLTPRFFEVQVLEPNGKPASSAYAYLTQTNQAPIVGSGATDANAEGRVRLMGFEGLDYLLWAHLGSWPSDRCAQVLHLDPNQTATAPIVMKITLTQAGCSKQAQEARSAAYATQKH